MSVQNNVSVGAVQYPQEVPYQYENPNWEQYSPKERYLKLREIVQELGIYRPLHKVQKKHIDGEVLINKGELSPTTVGVGGFFATYGVTRSIFDYFTNVNVKIQELSEISQKFDYIRGTSDIVMKVPDIVMKTPDSTRDKWISLVVEKVSFSPKLTLAAGAVSLAVGAGLFAKASYDSFESELKQEIDKLLQYIENESIYPQDLLERSNNIFEKRQSRFFGQFATRNPKHAVLLLIICGIAMDSNQKSGTAQERYLAALDSLKDDQWKPLLHYLLARSFRLSGNEDDANAHIAQINQFAPNSHFSLLGEIESIALNNEEEVFNEDGIPFIFVCPITQEIINEPAIYNIGNQTFRFEKYEIVDWITRDGTCPVTRKPLTLANLEEDPQLVSAIQAWKQTRLIT